MFSYNPRNLILLCIVLLTSCGKSLPTLEGIDLKAWKEDHDACLGVRSKMIDAISTEKEKLKALDEMQVVSLLGRPDENELYTRNQKFYNYYLEPGPGCENGVEHPKKLILRFNAMGLAKETLID